LDPELFHKSVMLCLPLLFKFGEFAAARLVLKSELRYL